jgi:hypothetical protein
VGISDVLMNEQMEAWAKGLGTGLSPRTHGFDQAPTSKHLVCSTTATLPTIPLLLKGRHAHLL